MMDEAWAGAGSEIGPWISATSCDAGTVPGAIGGVAFTQSLGKAFRCSWYIERTPVERVDSRLIRRILHIVKNYGVGLQGVGRGGWIVDQAPVEFKRRRFVFA